MTEKDKAFSYIDSHSGAGMYQLLGQYAQKTGEYKEGIDKLIKIKNLPQLLADYVSLINELQEEQKLTIYPGSPAIAKQSMRKQDTAQLFELHKTDFDLLSQFCSQWRQANIQNKDGYKGLLRQLPPPSRRGVVLIDPPYEIKSDYQHAVETIINGVKKFATGTYILWYPVVTRSYIDKMAEDFIDSKIRNILQVEFCLNPDAEKYGMTGTGLFIINPPWKLKSLLEESMPVLKQHIGNSSTQSIVTQLVAE